MAAAAAAAAVEEEGVDHDTLHILDTAVDHTDCTTQVAASYWGCIDRTAVAEAAVWVVVGTADAVVPEMGEVAAAAVAVVVETVEVVVAAHLVVAAVAEMVDTAAAAAGVVVAFLEAFGRPMVPAAALAVDVDRMAAYPTHHSEAVPDVSVVRVLSLLLVLGTTFLLVFQVLPAG